MDVTDKHNKKYIDKPAFTFENAKYNLKNITAHKENADLQEFFSWHLWWNNIYYKLNNLGGLSIGELNGL